MAATTGQKTTSPKRGAGAKKPVARKRVQAAPSASGRFFRENARLLLTLFAAVVIGVALFVSYRAATASQVFQTNRIDVEGAKRASNVAIETIAQRLTQKTGVWNADLDLIRGEVERLAWVKSASVSRVLPDGLRVRVIERNPIAVIRSDTGKLLWIDEEGKMLGAVLQSEKAPPFALIGWNEIDSDAARKNNQERLSLYLKLLDEFQTHEIANRITAIDLSDLQDAEVLVEKDNSPITVQVGREDYTAHLKLAIEVIDGMQDGQAADVEKIIAHNARVSIVPRRTALMANIESLRSNKRQAERR